MAKQNRHAPQGKPIASHPLFPAMVTLWFAALFGLSSLAIHPRLIESLIIAAQIDRLIAAATPPLDITARILLALAVTVPGALLGLVIGKSFAWFARSADPDTAEATTLGGTAELRTDDSQPDAPPLSPVSAAEEIGTGEIQDGAAVPARRRRSLTLPDHEELYDIAPLPGGALQILNIADLAFNEPVEAEAIADPISKPAPVDQDEANDLAVPVKNIAESEPVAAAEPSSTGEAEPANLIGLVDRLAQSMEQRRLRDLAGASTAALSPQPDTTQNIELPPEPLDLPAAMRPISLDYGQDDEHEELGALLPQRIISPPLSPAAEDISDAWHDEDEDALDEPLDERDGYSSLLNLGRIAAARQSAAHNADTQIAGDPAEPVVIFPGQAARVAAAEAPQPSAAAEADDTERALRTALSSLQRMSGAA